jgi:hypothetical protein
MEVEKEITPKLKLSQRKLSQTAPRKLLQFA